jgi:hypothetical protein
MLFANILDQLMGTCCMGFFMVMAVIVGLTVLAGKVAGGMGSGGSTGGSVAGKVGGAVVWKLISIAIGVVLKKRK